MVLHASYQVPGESRLNSKSLSNKKKGRKEWKEGREGGRHGGEQADGRERRKDKVSKQTKVTEKEWGKVFSVDRASKGNSNEFFLFY